MIGLVFLSRLCLHSLVSLASSAYIAVSSHIKFAPSFLSFLPSFGYVMRLLTHPWSVGQPVSLAASTDRCEAATCPVGLHRPLPLAGPSMPAAHGTREPGDGFTPSPNLMQQDIYKSIHLL